MSNDSIAIWRLMTRHKEATEAFRWFSQSNRIAIGWGGIGSVEFYKSIEDIKRAIRSVYPDAHNHGYGGKCLHDFCFTMKIGDLVILSDGRSRSVMEVQSRYMFQPEREPDPIGDYQNQRSAIVLPINPDVLWRAGGSGPREKQSIYWALIECRKTITLSIKERLLAESS